ncbi:MAG: AAA family ATPase [Bacteroidales bacterium]|nr:AAA family ATPase [Clostridium sp.]MCM1204003.1 AAA family ATPase [Bacteroidales bacterium]
MDICLKEILVENFKSYEDMQKIEIANLGVFMGANSSGKSTALQTLLAIKQTMECNSPDVNLLLSGKYVTLGDFDDVINQSTNADLKMGIAVEGDSQGEDYGKKNKTEIIWTFQKDNTRQSKLTNMQFKIENEDVQLALEKNDIYRIFVNGNDTQLSVKLINLKLSGFIVNYNKEFNELFQRFINDLIKNISSEKKVSIIEKTKMVSQSGINQLFYYILNCSRNINVNTTRMINDNAENVTNMILDLIDEYCEFQFKYFKNYIQFPYELRQTLLFANIMQKESIEPIEKLYEEYRQKLDTYKEKGITSCDVQDELPRTSIYSLKSVDKGKDSEIDIIAESFTIYRETIKNVIERIFYLGPIREQPQGLYNVGFETIPKYVGKSGAYFASVLLHENKNKEYILPNGCMEKMDLLEAVDEWAVHLNIASEIKVEQRNSFGFSVSIANTQQKQSDIMNVGIGTSQVLPVLITGLLSEEGELLIFEQPELHLHPFSQSRLADFFVQLVKKGRRIIVETHSEYFILRLRYHILTNGINENQITINFFQNKNGTRISKGILSGYGTIQYPSDFCDETQELINDLMNAALMKKRNENNEKYTD